jgi:hypothetical protein
MNNDGVWTKKNKQTADAMEFWPFPEQPVLTASIVFLLSRYSLPLQLGEEAGDSQETLLSVFSWLWFFYRDLTSACFDFFSWLDFDLTWASSHSHVTSTSVILSHDLSQLKLTLRKTQWLVFTMQNTKSFSFRRRLRGGESTDRRRTVTWVNSPSPQ